MSNTSSPFHSDLLNLYSQIRTFHEKYSCTATFIAIIDKNNGLFTTSSFNAEERVNFLNQLIEFIEKGPVEKLGTVPEFNN